MEEKQHPSGNVDSHDVIGNGIGEPDPNLTVTDADVTESGGGGDLGGGRVGGDLAEVHRPPAEDQGSAASASQD